MPVESAPTLAPELPRPVTAAGTVPRLERSPMARAESVDPLLRSARGQVASLRLRARTAQRAAERAEVALAEHDASSFEAERDARMAVVAAEAEESRRRRDATVAAAAQQAEALVAAARADADAEVARARRELHAAVAAVAAAPAVAGPVVAARLTGPPEDEPEGEPPLPPAASYPPPAPSSAPTVPPPGAPAPNRVVAAPYAATLGTVWLQGVDGTLQQAVVLQPAGLPVSMPFTVPAAAGAIPPSATPVAQSTALVPVPTAPAAAAPAADVAVPAPAAAAPPVAVAAPAPAPSAGRRLLHLDVILPLVAVLIVLVVLLAWLG